jgi:phosphoglycolate phosphatase
MIPARHVVFDLDGTLVDSLPGIRWSVEAAAEETGIPVRQCDLKALIGPPIRWILAELSGIPGGPALDRLERAFRASYDSAGWRRTVCYPGAAGMLRGLAARGVALWLVTNKPAAATHRILQRLEMADFFAEIVCRDSRVPAYQSKDEMLVELLLRRGFPAAESLLVGDTLEDAHAALAAGMACALLPHGYGYGLDGPLPAGCRRIGAWSELLSGWEREEEAQLFAASVRLGEGI